MEILKLNPVLKDYIWGGERLKNDFGFESNLDKVAEGWMLSCHKDGKNTIDGGEYDGQALDDVIEKIGKEKIVGTRSLDFPYFPVLIKLIDAKDNLSIQVHPDNDYAQRVERVNSAKRKYGMCLMQQTMHSLYTVLRMKSHPMNLKTQLKTIRLWMCSTALR